MEVFMLTMFVVASVWLGLAVVPTLIANTYFLPEHLLEAPMADEEIPQLDGLNGANNK